MWTLDGIMFMCDKNRDTSNDQHKRRNGEKETRKKTRRDRFRAILFSFIESVFRRSVITPKWQNVYDHVQLYRRIGVLS